MDKNVSCGLLVCALCLVLGCEGVIGSGASDGRSGPSDPGFPGAQECGRSICGATGELAVATAFPRLTHTQWENTVRDLLRLDETPNLSESFEPDTRISFFDNNNRVVEVAELHIDVIALALSCEYTHAVTLQVGTGNDNTRYWWQGEQFPSYHWISHRIFGDGSEGDPVDDFGAAGLEGGLIDGMIA